MSIQNAAFVCMSDDDVYMTAHVSVCGWYSKRVLEEFATETNWATSQFQQIHEHIHQAVESIVPASEYTAFVHQYRS